MLVISDSEGALDPSAALNTDQEELEESPGPCPSEHPGACSPGFGAPMLLGFLRPVF